MGGGHSLYVFLYHMLIRNWMISIFVCKNKWVSMFVYVTAMFFGSIAIEFVFYLLKICFKKANAIVLDMKSNGSLL